MSVTIPRYNAFYLPVWYQRRMGWLQETEQNSAAHVERSFEYLQRNRHLIEHGILEVMFGAFRDDPQYRHGIIQWSTDNP